jgi:hypothetical protein
LNVEWAERRSTDPFPCIQHSTFNIEHSTFAFQRPSSATE